MRRFLLAAAVTGGFVMSAGYAAAECGTVTIANMNWQSGEVLANIDGIILSEGFGCNVELVAGDTVPSITSMVEKGQPDLVPEGWVNVIPDILERGLEEGSIQVLSDALTEGGVAGIWIPQYLADEHPDLRTLQDVLKRPDLFPAPEDASKGAIVTSPQGWGAATIMSQLFKANGGEEAGFVLVDPGSAAGLDGSLARAYEQEVPWVGYYWAPTALMGKYPMVRIDLGAPFDEDEWNRCTTVADCPDPKPTEWPKDPVQTLVTADFAERAGPALDYLRARGWENRIVNEVSAFMTDNQATGEGGAIHFLKNYEEIWTEWVSPEVAEKIKAAL